MKSHFLLSITFLLFTVSHAQIKINYDIFKHTPNGSIEINSLKSPIFEQYSPVVASPQFNINTLNVNKAEQNEATRREADAMINKGIEESRAKVEKQLMEEKMYRDYKEWLNKTALYRQTLQYLDKLYEDSFSITKSVFLIENAWSDNKLSYVDFLQNLRFRRDQVQQILKREKLDSKNNIALNYGIQKLFSQPNVYYNKRTKQSITLPPFRYSFDDYMGKKKYENVFASKMLKTGKGQCHSMPLVYLMIAEQLGAKAWLSLAPQHSFVQFADKDNRLIDFETTNGHIVSSNWMLQSGFINASALKNKIYLDTLSKKDLYAQCLADML